MKNSTYYKRKSEGLCRKCGKLLDREGAICTECLVKNREEGKATRKAYVDSGVCPRCGKNSLMGSEKNCPECRAKMARNMNRYIKRDRKKYNSTMREYHKQLRERHKADGICVICGTRKATEGHTTCARCRTKGIERKRIANYQPLTRYERGLCKFCDNPVEAGYKVCEQHHKMLIERSRSAKAVEARKEWFKRK